MGTSTISVLEPDMESDYDFVEARKVGDFVPKCRMEPAPIPDEEWTSDQTAEEEDPVTGTKKQVKRKCKKGEKGKKTKGKKPKKPKGATSSKSRSSNTVQPVKKRKKGGAKGKKTKKQKKK